MQAAKDLEHSVCDIKNYVHRATIAILEALNFRLELPKGDKKVIEAARQIDKVLNKIINRINTRADETADMPLVKVA